VNDDGSFPVESEAFDVCILDNVLEHIERPVKVIDECSRITGKNGGLVICVPGIRGFQWDSDHKCFYDEDRLKRLDSRWVLTGSFSLPFFIQSQAMSKRIKQYCVVAIYRKAQA
jgi:SAM-dependent methyltransferase